MDPFFIRSGDHFAATESTRGPWSEGHQHGGPPAGLAARAIEALLPAPSRVARMIVELPRPVPIAPLTVAAKLDRAGRRAIQASAEITAGGVVVLRATALAVREIAVELPPPPDEPPPPRPDDGWRMPFFRWERGYHEAMELRIATGRFGEGKMACWMRMRVPLVDGEEPSPLVRAMVAADSGNGVALLLDIRRHTFLNADVTVHLHRLPVGEWVCLDARTRVAPGGVGLAETRLLDDQGPFGRGAQTLIIDAV